MLSFIRGIMAGTSVTGVGVGSAERQSIHELTILANAPAIIFAGTVESTAEEISSPPTAYNYVVFPYALGDMDNYVILLTTLNAGAVYVSDRDEDEEGNFTGFSFVAETEGTVMYIVSRIGSRPNL